MTAAIVAVEERSIPAASVLREAHPADLAGDTLTVEFPATAAFHRQLAEEPKNATLLAEALYEVTGRRLGLAFAEGEPTADVAAQDDEPLGEGVVLRLCDLLAVAVDDMRQGGDPRLPLELALVKVTRPAADLSRDSIAYRLEQLEQRLQAAAGVPAVASSAHPASSDAAAPAPTAPVSRTQWVVVGQEEDPTAENWVVTAYAVCAIVA